MEGIHHDGREGSVCAPSPTPSSITGGASSTWGHLMHAKYGISYYWLSLNSPILRDVRSNQYFLPALCKDIHDFLLSSAVQTVGNGIPCKGGAKCSQNATVLSQETFPKSQICHVLLPCNPFLFIHFQSRSSHASERSKWLEEPYNASSPDNGGWALAHLVLGIFPST